MSEKQTNLEQRQIHSSSLRCSQSSKKIRTSVIDIIDNVKIESEFTNQESFVDQETAFKGNNASIRSENSARTGHILTSFPFLIKHYKLLELEKIKCKMRKT